MNILERKINNFISHYDDNKYWKMKFKLNESTPKIIQYYYLYKMKKSEAFNNASLGNRVGGGSKFDGKPTFPHGIKGVFITDYAHVGKNVTIFQQVTIGVKDYETELKNNAPTIGDNCFIGAGAKIIGPIKIGNNVKIGANCVVCEDVPDNTTVVLNRSRIIIKK